MAGFSREDVDAGRIDFSDMDSGERLGPVTPGDILREDFLAPLQMSGSALALELGVPGNRITGILNGSRALTADTALRLERRFGVSARFWLGLQAAYDLECARGRSAA